MKEMEKFFNFSGSSWCRQHKKEKRSLLFTLLSLSLPLRSHFYDVGRGSRTIIRKVSLPSDGY